LARDHASGGVGIALRCSRCLNTGAVGASINVTDLHAPLLIKSRVKEVEQIATNIGLAVHPDATALDWICRGRIGYGPMESSVKCICNIEVPDTTEVVCCTVSGNSRTVESHCGAAGIACHCGGKSNVFQTVSSAHIIDVLPCLTAVGRSGHDGVAATGSSIGHCAIRHSKIDTAGTVDCYRRILKIRVSASLSAGVLNRPYDPR
jgi:hypothetical protein